ncbi:hypothetical protein [Photobacterium lipolyticum]|nr:hypothetical protein [Photobacterium lipolyticum]
MDDDDQAKGYGWRTIVTSAAKRENKLQLRGDLHHHSCESVINFK